MNTPTPEQWENWYNHTSNRDREIARMEYEEETGERQCDNEDNEPEKTEEEEEFNRNALLGISPFKRYD